MVLMVQLERLAQRVLLDQKETKGIRVTLAILDPLVLLDHKVNRVFRGQLESRAYREYKEKQALQDFRDYKGKRDQLELMELRVFKEKLD
jgi:hypothetical protein